MRKIIASAFTSMDGVMQSPSGPDEDPNGGFEYGGWLTPLADEDEVFGEEVGKLLEQKYDLLLGRRTYDIFAAYWPHQEGGPNNEIAVRFNRATKYVATRSSDPLSWNRSVALHDAATDVAKLKRDDGPPLLTQGSSDLLRTLLAHDLVDEIHVFLCPVILGKGKRLIEEGAHARTFRLTHSRVSPKGIVIATYARAGEVQTEDLAKKLASAEASTKRDR